MSSSAIIAVGDTDPHSTHELAQIIYFYFSCFARCRVR